MNIKIFMCTHKAPPLLPPLCTAVLGGSVNRGGVPNTIGDVGKNGDISHKNKEYCELTVQYYAFKNEICDFYGLCHYRRFFGSEKSTKRPYLALGKPKAKHLASAKEITELCGDYDVILPRQESVGLTAYDKYVSSKHHFKEDIDLFLEIIKEKAPFLVPFAEEYMQGYEQYFCNMFIMRKEIFMEYSSLLFSLLNELDKRKTPHGYFEADRTNGYLGERLLGIYVLYLKSIGTKIYHLPRIDAYSPLKKRIINKLLPPQSKLRLKINAKRGSI